MVAIKTNLSDVAEECSVSPTVGTATSKRSTKSSKSSKSMKSSSFNRSGGGDAKSVSSHKSRSMSLKKVISSLSKMSAKSVAPSTNSEDERSPPVPATVPMDIGTVASLSEVRDDISEAPSVKSTKSGKSAAAARMDDTDAVSVAASAHSTESSTAAPAYVEDATTRTSVAASVGSAKSGKSCKSFTAAPAEEEDVASVRSKKSVKSCKSSTAAPADGRDATSIAASVQSTKSVKSCKSSTASPTDDKDAMSVAASAQSTKSIRATMSAKSSTASPADDKDATSIAASVQSRKSIKSSTAALADEEEATSFAASKHSTGSHRSSKSAKSTKSVSSRKSEVPGVAGAETGNNEQLETSVKEEVTENGDESVAAASVNSTASRTSKKSTSVVAGDASEVMSIGDVASAKTTPSLLALEDEASEDDDRSATTTNSEAMARRLLRQYGFGVGMRMYRKSLELAKKEQKQATQRLTQVTEEEPKQLEENDSTVLAEDRDEHLTDVASVASKASSKSMKSKSTVKHMDAKSVNSSVFQDVASVPSATKVVTKEENDESKNSKSMEFEVEALSRTETDREPVVEVLTEKTSEAELAKDTEPRTKLLDELELVLSFFRNMCGFFSTIDEAAKDLCRQGERLVAKLPEDLLKLESSDKNETLDSMLEDIGEKNTSDDEEVEAPGDE